MSLAPGARLGAYEILGPLGSGGMGDVYRARDPRLDREIAIKVLPEPASGDPERRERFEREARSIAALNHPHIVTIHSVEEAGGTHFLTMEIVHGRTIADLIPDGGMPVERLLQLAVPLTDAIAAAHQKGIVHRDLKPANVMVREDGWVKVLDFGLAKSTGPLVGDATVSNVRTEAGTGEGRILGTVAYMSPEQAEGRAVDHRTDIFSMGVMLYEMVTGERPFKGDTSISVISSIVKDTPASVTSLKPSVPRELAQIIKRMLAKDPERRYQSAKDIRNELEDLRQELQSGEVVAAPVSAPAPATRTSWVPWAAAAAAIVIIAGGAYAYLGNDSDDGGREGPPSLSFARVTSQQGIEGTPSLSPDGRWVVYSGAGDIFLQSVGGQSPINLTKDLPAFDSHPEFSPDGEQIAFSSTGASSGIFTMGRTGESVRRVTDGGFNPSWSPDGKEIVFATAGVTGLPHERATSTSTLAIVNVASGAQRPLTDTDAVQPVWSPNGHRIAYWRIRVPGRPTGQRDIWTVPAAGGTPTPVTDDAALDWTPEWSPDGRYLYYSSDRNGSMNLWRVRIDEASGKVLGDPEPITTPSPFVGQFSFSSDGSKIAFESRVVESNVQKVGFDPASGKTIGSPTRITTGSQAWLHLDVSADGDWLVMRPSYGQEDLYVSKADGSGLRQVTADEARDRHPRWSPDGQTIAFYSDREGPLYHVWSVRPDGSGLKRLSFDDKGGYYPSWSHDGRRIAASQSSSVGGALLIFDPAKPWKEQTITPVPPPPDGFRRYVWTADDRALLGESDRARGGLMRYSLETRTFERLTEEGGTPRLLPGGRNAIYLGGDGTSLMLIDLQTKQVRTILDMPGVVIRGLAVSRDGRAIFFTPETSQADIWMATFATPPRR